MQETLRPEQYPRRELGPYCGECGENHWGVQPHGARFVAEGVPRVTNSLPEPAGSVTNSPFGPPGVTKARGRPRKEAVSASAERVRRFRARKEGQAPKVIRRVSRRSRGRSGDGVHTVNPLDRGRG